MAETLESVHSTIFSAGEILSKVHTAIKSTNQPPSLIQPPSFLDRFGSTSFVFSVIVDSLGQNKLFNTLCTVFKLPRSICFEQECAYWLFSLWFWRKLVLGLLTKNACILLISIGFLVSLYFHATQMLLAIIILIYIITRLYLSSYNPATIGWIDDCKLAIKSFFSAFKCNATDDQVEEAVEGFDEIAPKPLTAAQKVIFNTLRAHSLKCIPKHPLRKLFQKTTSGYTTIYEDASRWIYIQSFFCCSPVISEEALEVDKVKLATKDNEKSDISLKAEITLDMSPTYSSDYYTVDSDVVSILTEYQKPNDVILVVNQDPVTADFWKHGHYQKLWRAITNITNVLLTFKSKC